MLSADLESPYFARVLSAFKAYCIALKYAGGFGWIYPLFIEDEKLKEVVLRYASEAQQGTV